jgi:hypothetical protein
MDAHAVTVPCDPPARQRRRRPERWHLAAGHGKHGLSGAGAAE